MKNLLKFETINAFFSKFSKSFCKYFVMQTRMKFRHQQLQLMLKICQLIPSTKKEHLHPLKNRTNLNKKFSSHIY
jgi:hypothetical protein